MQTQKYWLPCLTVAAELILLVSFFVFCSNFQIFLHHPKIRQKQLKQEQYLSMRKAFLKLRVEFSWTKPHILHLLHT